MQASRFLVTGGSQGIGAAIVELACRAGHQVVFTGRNEQLSRVGRNNPNKLYAEDIGEAIMAALNMPRRALWPEPAVFANNPWKEDYVLPFINTVTHRGRRGARLARREERAYREYVSDEQRRQSGCIAGRMPPYL
jgi:NADPH:quinone reductase-like Zn-dependent oxidoreductase